MLLVRRIRDLCRTNLAIGVVKFLPRFLAFFAHVQVGWFESRSAPSRKWAVQERKFTVQRPIPKHSDGRAHFLVTDSGVPE